MSSKTRTRFAATALAYLALASPSFAATVSYNFSPVSGEAFGSGSASTGVVVGNATFTQANASTATYDFVFGPNGGLFSNINGGAGIVLSTAGYAGVSSAPASLTIVFSTSVYAIGFDFGNSDFFDNNGGDLLTAAINGTTVATVIPALASNGDFYPEGAFSYSNPNGFTSITVTSTDALGAEDLVLGDFTTSTTIAAVPEPSTWTMLLLGFAGVGFMAYRQKSKPALMAA